MKELLNVTRYKCEHCSKEYRKRFYAIKHEEKCTKNPDNFSACEGCVFLEEKTKALEYENDYGYPVEVQAKSFFCKKKNIGLYPVKVIHKGLLKRHPDTFKGEERMPAKCSEFKYDVYF